MPSYSLLAARLLGFGVRELGAGVSDAAIAAAERALGVRIAGSYREFLRQFGWGSVAHWELFGLGGPSHLSLVRITQSERMEMEPALPTYLLPILNNGGGDLYCLDTRVREEPPVVLWVHEDGVEQVPEIVAQDFTSWLWALMDDVA